MWKHVTFKKQIKFIDFEIKTKYLEFLSLQKYKKKIFK